VFKCKFMQYSIVCLLSLFLFGCQTKSDTAIDIRVMYFNIRTAWAKDGKNGWEYRKPLVSSVINKYAPDVLGLQEANPDQMDYLIKTHPKYGVVGLGRDGGKKGEYSAIMYLKDRFTVDEQGTFWLSDTPQKPSRGWGNSHLRICSWLRLIESKTNKAFYVFNTHLDHQSQKARDKSAKLIMKRIKDRKHKDPVVLTGDFNAGENNSVIKHIKSEGLIDSFRALYPNEKVVGTFNGGYRGNKNSGKIDYVFISKGQKTLSAHINRIKIKGRYPSDHYPVTARVNLK
jgi:endonuclease/exonuclease/phosphatase family metal-dependent hydrolase